MGKFINREKAMQFLDEIEDPGLRILLENAYATIFLERLANFQGELDLLFFFRFMAAFLRDRKQLAKDLANDPTLEQIAELAEFAPQFREKLIRVAG